MMNYSPVGTQLTQTTPAKDNEQYNVIMSKLCSIENCQKNIQSKLNKIETDVKAVSGKVTLVEVKVASLEIKISEADKKLAEFEQSRAFDSETCDEIKRNHTELLNSIKTLNNENSSLSENILDLQSRSMRDNLLFFNFEEEKTFEDRKSENCLNKIIQFCEDDLKIEDSKSKIKIDRAHRIGHFEHGKKRPIVVKFNYFGDKIDIKNKAREYLRDSVYRVSDQYPKVIQDRRRKLVPYLVQARQAGKQASLSNDVLYIDRVRYTHDHPPPGPTPALPPRGPRNQRRGDTGSQDGQGQPRPS